MSRAGGENRLSIPETIPTAERIEADFADFTDETLIGSGGNADVYRMRYSGPGPDIVAVKQPRLAGTVDLSEFDAFMEEAETWSKLDDHDHIVGVLDWGSEPLPWIALEYMDGGGLDAQLNEISTAEALWTGVCICRAVRHAHRRGVAHLDLKPENVLFRETPEGMVDVPKVSDWGLAKMLLEHSKSIDGLSPHYAAPEQFGDGSPNDFTDIYQTGAVIYAALTGRPPFEGSAHSVMGDVLSTEPTPPSEVADVPKAVDEPILTALSKEKDDRQESILDLRRELEACLDDLTSEQAGETEHEPMGNERTTSHEEHVSTGTNPQQPAATSRTDSATARESDGFASGTETSAMDLERMTESTSTGSSRRPKAPREPGDQWFEGETADEAKVEVEDDADPESTVLDPGRWHYAAGGSLLLMLIGVGAGADVFVLLFFVFLYAYNRDLKELARAEAVAWTPRRWIWLPGLFFYPITIPYYFYKRWKETKSS